MLYAFWWRHIGLLIAGSIPAPCFVGFAYSLFSNHHGASNANILGFLYCVFGSLQRMARRIMRKFILKLRIALLKRSIKAWAAEVSQSDAAMTIIHKEQSQRYLKLAQLEQQHDTL